ncbi:hypothetical protein L1987_41655 [Smallanthus sonchifolius]|uniref:Uncharacterized protein n=1 Tax=Smallanthus sonchifolius TaxID=185202 RepID=A0ACB9GW49_9ASTR|nr:hypothetical protein L1987_41655 [Smallanthus sonchifolius]
MKSLSGPWLSALWQDLSRGRGSRKHASRCVCVGENWSKRGRGDSTKNSKLILACSVLKDLAHSSPSKHQVIKVLRLKINHVRLTSMVKLRFKPQDSR